MRLHNLIYSAAAQIDQVESPVTGGSVWLTQTGSHKYPDSNNAMAYGVKSAPDGSVYCCGYRGANVSGQPVTYLQKYTESGVLSWERQLSGGYSGGVCDIDVDSSGNIYVAGQHKDLSADKEKTRITKFNSDGAVQWQTVVATTTDLTSPKISVNSSGQCLIVSRRSTNGMAVTKLSAAGVILWQRSPNYTYNLLNGRPHYAADGSVFVVGYCYHNNSMYKAVFLKYDAVGTLLGGGMFNVVNSTYGTCSAVDSAGNLLISGYRSRADGTQELFVSKFNGSTFAHIWTTVVYHSTSSNHIYIWAIDVDEDDSVYLAGNYKHAASDENCLICKLSSAGVFEWSNGLRNSNYLKTDSFIDVDIAGGDFVAAGYTTVDANNAYDSILVKFPKDNSNLGQSYFPMTYDSVALLTASPGITIAAQPLTQASITYTNTNPSLAITNVYDLIEIS